MIIYEQLEELRQQINDKSTDLSNIKELTSTVSGLEYKLASSQGKLLDLKSQVLMESKKVEKGASVAASTERVVADLKIKLQASQMKSEGLSTELQNSKTALTDHIVMVKEKTASDDTAQSKLQDNLTCLRTEFEQYRRESKKGWMT